MRRFYKKRKQRLHDLKADSACALCGNDDPRVLDFHHRNRDDKSFSIGTSAWQVSEKRLIDEIQKCDVLCANCHRIQHYIDGLYDSYKV